MRSDSQPYEGLLSHYPNIEDHRPALKGILEEFGTPILACDREILIDRYQSLSNSLADHWGKHIIGYSFKTNYLVAESRVLQKQGAWAEVVSGREYELACRLAFPPSEIIYNGPYKDDSSLFSALANNSIVNINDHDELDRVIAHVAGNDRRHKIGIRVTSDLTRLGISRFGFSLENDEARDAVRKIDACSALTLVGLHTHLYGDTDDPELYALAATRVGQFAKHEIANYQNSLEFIDMGGGFPAHSPKPKSRQEWNPQPIDVYIKHIAESLEQFFPNQASRPLLIVEPGRYLTCDGIIFVTRVVHVKERFSKQLITCDGSLSMVPLTHYCPQIIRLFGPDLSRRQTKEVPSIIQGATCRENDLLYDGAFAEAQVGDYLIHFAAGAYNSNLSPNFIFAAPEMKML
ncbi:MAG: alanine racemase [Planctomycetales bacterium]|nr:alanine racemase [Planctomycetales bacterium]